MGLAPQRNQLPADRRVPDSGDLNAGVDVAEYIRVGTDRDHIEVSPAEDGGAFVDLPGERVEATPSDEGFYSNLAKVLPDEVKSQIVSDLLRKIEQDKQARSKRDEQYEEGIRRTGLGKDAPGGAEFEGASRVVHPMMTEACIDYESRIIKELFPPSGPVKPKLIGTPTAEKAEKAQRKTEHMNWQITTQIREARAVLETTLTQVPLGGSQFIHQWWDHRLKRPRWEFAPIDNIYIPFNAANYMSASRRTYADTITDVEYRHRVEQGQYLDDMELPSASQEPDASKAEVASRKVEGLEDPGGANIDGDREIYETMSWLEVTDDMAAALDGDEQVGEIYPFLITMDVQSRQMLACYRDWEAGDEAREPIDYFFEFPFIPWRGAYSIGFPQIIGGLSAAATGALRALLDSAHVNNATGGLIIKGAGAGGQTKRAQVGEFTEIDVGLETDDIRKKVLPFSFNQPSPVLYQLLGFLNEAAGAIVRTSLDESPNSSPTPVPVGTQMSRVEEGLVVFSAIHGRAHAALDRLLAGLHRLNRLYLPEMLKVDAAGKELLVRRKDYEGPCDVCGVSDPTIYSDQQRFTQLAYIQGRQAAVPNLYNARALELWGLKLMRIPDPEALLNAAPEPHELNAVNENLAMALGQPVTVFPEQDHLAHLQVLLSFMQSPVLGMNPIIAPRFLPQALGHAAEHIVYYYVTRTVDLVQQASGRPVVDLMSKDDEVKATFDRLLAQASQQVTPEVMQAMQGAMPVLQQAMQLAQQVAPKPPMDPSQAAVQAAAAETQRRTADDQAGHQLAQQKQQTDAQIQAQKQQTDASKDQTAAQLQAQRNQIDADRVQAQRETAAMAAATKVRTTEMDNETARAIAVEKAPSDGKGSRFKNGESMTH